MKKILLGSVGLVALSVVSAQAADLAARPRTYTKAPMISPAFDWSGFYIGLNGGGGSSHNCWTNAGIGEGCHDATGGTVGGQIGYRWQMANWVFGLEGQGNWADFKGSNASLVFANTTNQTKIDAFGLMTGQIGYAFNNVLVYAKGGAAVTDTKYTGLVAGVAVDQATQTRWGGTVGAGLEVGFAQNWSVGVEYDHLFMGTNNVTLTTGGIATRTDSFKQDVDMGLVRLNYRFGGPVIAKYRARSSDYPTDPAARLIDKRPASRRPFCCPRGGRKVAACVANCVHFRRNCGRRVTVFHNRVGYVDARPRKNSRRHGPVGATLKTEKKLGTVMKKFLLTTVGLVALGVAPALAADLPARAYTKAPVAPAPIYNWTGLYIGAMGGYGKEDAGISPMSGGFGGGTLGYNWQTGFVVLGVEADAAWSNINATATLAGVGTASAKIQDLGTVRGRIGYAFDPFLLYATGGYAWADTKLSATALGVSIADSKVLNGWTVGAGIEAMFAPHWSVKGEYLYRSFESQNFFTNLVPGGIPSQTVKVNSFQVGVNYHF
jgi:outer membrane immunogenic protein